MKLGFEPLGWDLSHVVGMRALGLGFGSRGWDLGPEIRIWALKLGYGLMLGFRP